MVCVSLLTFSSCEDFLNEVKGPTAKIESKVMFADDVTAAAAITGIYQTMVDLPAYSSGSSNSITYLAGLSSDELISFYRTDVIINEIEENKISTKNTYILGLWGSMYKIMYAANAAISKIEASTGMTPNAKQQLTGEALFIRAMTHFYLVNIFGNVPLVTTTSYDENSKISRTSESQVYDQILLDLVKARDLMMENYPTTERVRPNKATASALLARVYLYKKEWKLAVDEASKILDQTGVYQLAPDLNSVFLSNSTEAIWQIQPSTPNFNTWDGYYFVISPWLGPMYVSLRNEFISSFEDDDQRLTAWVGTYDTGSETLFYPFKYKADLFAPSTTEYSVIFRLAEIFLIRAEAHAMLGNLPSAISDIDKIRTRAGLSSIADTNSGISQEALLNVIYHERKTELFTEWGHRWFDLKRLGTATAELSTLKPNITENDLLYPVPEAEILRNTKLLPQNKGY